MEKSLIKFKNKSKNKIYELTAEQRRMYKSEALYNFRGIYHLLATRSPYKLTAQDTAPPCVSHFLNEIGQFAEVAYGPMSPPFVWKHLDDLSRPGYPLDHRIYDALPGAVLLESVYGKVAKLHASLVYRPSQNQFVVAFSGTSSVSQALRDCNAIHHRYKTPDGTKGFFVHSGFWSMYKGVRMQMLEALRKSAKKYGNVNELIVTGHSLGGALSYLFCLDVLHMTADPIIKPGTKIVIAAFGAPRVGNAALVEHWRALIRQYRETNGPLAFTELFVKAYKDGVPTLPTLSMGFRHFPETTYYLAHGKLYTIPPSENEHMIFDIEPDTSKDDAASSLRAHYPRGGHNYYGRDIEKLGRGMKWIDATVRGEKDWELRYIKKRDKWEKKWSKKIKE